MKIGLMGNVGCNSTVEERLKQFWSSFFPCKIDKKVGMSDVSYKPETERP